MNRKKESDRKLKWNAQKKKMRTEKRKDGPLFRTIMERTNNGWKNKLALSLLDDVKA